MERFLEAQQDTYARALEEIKAGRKRSHWMWYIFPQIQGLGSSETSVYYAIQDTDEAREYLAHPVLGRRLREISEALLRLETHDAHAVFGSPDDMKLRSCMTLFDAVSPDEVFRRVLQKYYDNVPDDRTLEILGIEHAASGKNRGIMGAIIGDIVGSRFESRWKHHKSTDFTLFTSANIFTDDTVMTVAVADWLLGRDLVDSMRDWGRRYPDRGYGGKFRGWLFSQERQSPYNSFGNGSGMRVSPAGFYAHSLDEALDLARKSAEVTHNHPEGIKGAQAIASAIYLARAGRSKKEIRDCIEQTFGYDLHADCDDIRPNYEFDVTCQGSCPEAIIAFLDSRNYESAIRLAVSLGGDSDTIACMTGGIAAAFYGVPNAIIEQAIKYLPDDMLEVIREFDHMNKFDR